MDALSNAEAAAWLAGDPSWLQLLGSSFLHVYWGFIANQRNGSAETRVEVKITAQFNGIRRGE